jgi:hypothetical protein
MGRTVLKAINERWPLDSLEFSLVAFVANGASVPGRKSADLTSSRKMGSNACGVEGRNGKTATPPSDYHRSGFDLARAARARHS